MDEEILQGLRWFYAQFEDAEAPDDESLETYGGIDEEDSDVVRLRLPACQEDYRLHKEDFLLLWKECQTIITNKEAGTVRTNRRFFQVIKADRVNIWHPLTLPTTLEGRVCTAMPRNFIVAFAAYKTDSYDSDFHAPDSYWCIEIAYYDIVQRLSQPEEEELVASSLFELAAAGYPFVKGRFEDIPSVEESDALEDEMMGGQVMPQFRPLEPFNEGMRLFNAAIVVDDPELRLLSLYKILEYFGPVVLRLERNEALRKKLDSSGALQADAEFLESLYQLSISFKERSHDAELPNLVLKECVDMVELSNLLPSSLKKGLTYNSQKTEIDKLTKTVADALYTTRNSVAHAKSNYTKQGTEVPSSEMAQLTEFLKIAAIQTIRWHNRLPDHLRASF
jgi:hypothetical protein